MRTVYLELSRHFSAVSLSLIPWVLEDLRARSGVGYIFSCRRRSETRYFRPPHARKKPLVLRVSVKLFLILKLNSVNIEKTIFELDFDLTVKNTKIKRQNNIFLRKKS